MKTPDEFMTELEEYFGGKPLNAKQRLITTEELQKSFTSGQWEMLFRAVIKSDNRFMPKLGQILMIAKENGITKKESARGMGASLWTQEACLMCRGEGLLQVIMRHEYERGEILKRHRHFVELGPYSDGRWVTRKLEDGEYSYIFRCCCGAEETTNRPTSWPNWNPIKYSRSESELEERKRGDRISATPFRFKKAGDINLD